MRKEYWMTNLTPEEVQALSFAPSLMGQNGRYKFNPERAKDNLAKVKASEPVRPPLSERRFDATTHMQL